MHGGEVSSMLSKRDSSVLNMALAFVISAAVVGFLLFSSPGMVGIDGYYHIAAASLLWHEGIRFAFPYLEFTVLDQAHYVDMHMLFHIFQSPFAGFLGLELAAKLSATVFVASAFALFAWLLKQYDVPYPVFWVLVMLILSESFLYRMMMSRPPVFALAYSWLAFHCLMQKKHVALAVVACLFVWTYKVFPVLLPMAVVAMAVFYVQRRELSFKPLLAVLAGMACGLIINPYFPDNISFLWHAIEMKILSEGFHASVGNEWYPMNTLAFVKDAAIPLTVWVLGILLTNRDEWKNDPARLFWFLLSTMWLLMLLKSRRFIEFFPPSALLFFIFSIRPWFNRYGIRSLKTYRGLVAVIGVLMMLGGYHTLSKEYDSMQKAKPVGAYAGAAAWLVANTPQGSRVFHTDWDDFPRLFFYDRHNTYIVGLDPDYMRLKDAKAYAEWRDIGRGKNKHPADRIVQRFESEYVFTDNKHERFIAVADKSERMARVFHDKYATVYSVKSNISQ